MAQYSFLQTDYQLKKWNLKECIYNKTVLIHIFHTNYICNQEI